MGFVTGFPDRPGQGLGRDIAAGQRENGAPSGLIDPRLPNPRDRLQRPLDRPGAMLTRHAVDV